VEIEPARSVLDTAIAPQALICVGGLSLVFSTIVVGCHLVSTLRRGSAVFKQDDPLSLLFFYVVVVVFLAVALANRN
jgi:hypothetical protein